jgi:hypothetical protein
MEIENGSEVPCNIDPSVRLAFVLALALIKTRSCLSAGTPSTGVTTQTGIPEIVDDVIFTGYAARFALAPSAAEASVCARLCARVCFGLASETWCANPFCASGLTVAGSGTTRVMCAVPSASM